MVLSILTTRELKALIFDLDGVIVNTVDLHYQAWKHLFDELAIPFDRQQMEQFRGVHQRDILLTLTENLSEAQIARALARKSDLYQQALQTAAPEILNQPAITLLHAAKAQGLKIGLASSSTHAWQVLTLVDLLDQFDAIADGSTVCRSKPAPDIFVWVAGALGLRPPQIAVIEDGVAGIEGARTAGMFAVGLNVAPSRLPPHLNLSPSDLRLEVIRDQFRQQAAD